MNSFAKKADIVICGAGIAGVAAAYFLSMRRDFGSVLLVDDQAPLTLTSDKSSEGYRNWWPGPDEGMVRLMNRSIDLVELLAQESGNRFHMNRRGYIYLTADSEHLSTMRREAEDISRLGAGPLRFGQSYAASLAPAYDDPIRGADLVLDQEVIHKNYPFLSRDVVGLLHARRCGWLSAQQLGMLLLEKAREAGVQLLVGRISKVVTRQNQVVSVSVQTTSENIKIVTERFVNAAGPYAKSVAAMLDVDLPLYNELHGKIAFEDSLGIVPRNVPLMIWNDPISLPWSREERADLAAFGDMAWMLEPMPPGLHFRPEGGPGSKTLLILWPYHIQQVEEPVWPLKFDPEFIEVVLRGMVRMVPGMEAYLDRMSPPYVDGGYYTKTQENRPLICPLPVGGAYIIGGLSGYGIMAAMAGAELLAAYISNDSLPNYASSFHLSRYDDSTYQSLLKDWDDMVGQL